MTESRQSYEKYTEVNFSEPESDFENGGELKPSEGEIKSYLNPVERQIKTVIDENLNQPVDPEKFKIISLEDLIGNAKLDSTKWKKIVGSESQGTDALKKNGFEWVHKTSNFSLTRNAEGTEFETDHKKTLEQLYENGFSILGKEQTNTSEAEIHFYFADEKGNISYESYISISEKNVIEEFSNTLPGEIEPLPTNGVLNVPNETHEALAPEILLDLNGAISSSEPQNATLKIIENSQTTLRVGRELRMLPIKSKQNIVGFEISNFTDITSLFGISILSKVNSKKLSQSTEPGDRVDATTNPNQIKSSEKASGFIETPAMPVYLNTPKDLGVDLGINILELPFETMETPENLETLEQTRLENALRESILEDRSEFLSPLFTSSASEKAPGSIFSETSIEASYPTILEEMFGIRINDLTLPNPKTVETSKVQKIALVEYASANQQLVIKEETVSLTTNIVFDTKPTIQSELEFAIDAFTKIKAEIRQAKAQEQPLSISELNIAEPDKETQDLGIELLVGGTANITSELIAGNTTDNAPESEDKDATVDSSDAEKTTNDSTEVIASSATTETVPLEEALLVVTVENSGITLNIEPKVLPEAYKPEIKTTTKEDKLQRQNTNVIKKISTPPPRSSKEPVTVTSIKKDLAFSSKPNIANRQQAEHLKTNTKDKEVLAEKTKEPTKTTLYNPPQQEFFNRSDIEDRSRTNKNQTGEKTKNQNKTPLMSFRALTSEQNEIQQTRPKEGIKPIITRQSFKTIRPNMGRKILYSPLFKSGGQNLVTEEEEKKNSSNLQKRELVA